MTEKKYLNIHVLTSHSPSCLNRDDMNMQKSATFGGVRRVRISSQCLKRAMRMSEPYANRLGDPSIRTRDIVHLVPKYVETLKDQYAPELVEQTIALIAGKKEIKEGVHADAVAPWCVDEVAKICEIVKAAKDEELDEKKLQKKVAKESQSLLTAIANAPDIALFGRMATSGLMTSIDGAMAVAHAITTHAVDADIDWFTAVDDLTIDEGETGAGHLDTQEFGSGVFYRYASLNLGQLQENMGGAEREKVLEAAAHLAYLLATVVPTGKQQSFAAHNPADLVYACFADMPVSYANAFEKPVTAKAGFLAPSIVALQDYATQVATGYGLEEQTAVFCTQETTLQPKMSTFVELEEWICKGGQ